MGVNSVLPPLPAWPSTVHSHEPAHGFFRRLAEANGHSSIRPFAASYGLNGRNLDLAELVEFCSKLPVRNVQQLRHNTPTVQGSLVRIGREILRFPRDWSHANPRICPGCLNDGRYMRNWFDLNVLRSCPIHGSELYPDVAWQSLIGVDHQNGSCMAHKMDVIDPPPGIERYVLGRIGAIDGWSLPHLDDVSLHHIIDASEVLGYARCYGWSKTPPRRGDKHSASFREAVAEGFDILSEQKEVQLLTQYASSSLSSPIPGRINYFIQAYWGWLIKVIPNLEESRLSLQLNRLLLDLAAEKGIFSRRDGAAYRKNVGLKSLHELSAELEISHKSLRTIAIKLGLTDGGSRRAQAHTFDDMAVAQIRRLVEDLIPRREAADIVEAAWPGTLFETFCFRGGVLPFIRLHCSRPSGDQYRRSEIMAALSDRAA